MRGRVIRSNPWRVDVAVRLVQDEHRGANELARVADVFYVRPFVRVFGRVIWRGEERAGYEVVKRWRRGPVQL